MINPCSKIRTECDQTSCRHAQCDALFSEILNNDAIDWQVRLPDAIEMPASVEQFVAGFDLSRELWHDGLDRERLVSIAGTLFRDYRIDEGDSLAFKHARARFKHLRFVYAAFGDRHRYPILLDVLTSVMGNLQDAFKNNKHPSIRRNAILMRLLLNASLVKLMIAETGMFRPTTPEKFRDYMKGQAIKVAQFLQKKAITAQEFHDTRKIISLYRASFATLVTLEPSAHHVVVASYIATINGLMGNFHDGLMAGKLNGTLNYTSDTFPLPDEMRVRLHQLVSTMADSATG